jgi:hypothetical protein
MKNIVHYFIFLLFFSIVFGLFRAVVWVVHTFFFLFFTSCNFLFQFSIFEQEKKKKKTTIKLKIPCSVVIAQYSDFSLVNVSKNFFFFEITMKIILNILLYFEVIYIYIYIYILNIKENGE